MNACGNKEYKTTTLKRDMEYLPYCKVILYCTVMEYIPLGA